MATQPLTIHKTTITARDGVELSLKSWVPKKPKAIVVALHGFNDYSQGWVNAGGYFQKKRIALYAYDQRGFGTSPMRGIWAGEENLVADATALITSLHKAHPKTPIYLMGESMGGAVALLAAARPDMPPISGLILLAPAVWGGKNLNPFYQAMLWSMAHTMPDYQMTGRNLKILATNNIPVLQRMSKDPNIIKSTRVDAIYGLVGLMGDAAETAPHIEAPILLMYGDHDQVIPQAPVKKLLREFNHPATFVFYPGSYHMLTRDIQGKMVLEDIASWILRPNKPLPSGYAWVAD